MSSSSARSKDTLTPVESPEPGVSFKGRSSPTRMTSADSRGSGLKRKYRSSPAEIDDQVLTKKVSVRPASNHSRRSNLTMDDESNGRRLSDVDMIEDGNENTVEEDEENGKSISSFDGKVESLSNIRVSETDDQRQNGSGTSSIEDKSDEEKDDNSNDDEVNKVSTFSVSDKEDDDIFGENNNGDQKAKIRRSDDFVNENNLRGIDNDSILSQHNENKDINNDIQENSNTEPSSSQTSQQHILSASRNSPVSGNSIRLSTTSTKNGSESATSSQGSHPTLDEKSIDLLHAQNDNEKRTPVNDQHNVESSKDEGNINSNSSDFIPDDSIERSYFDLYSKSHPKNGDGQLESKNNSHEIQESIDEGSLQNNDNANNSDPLPSTDNISSNSKTSDNNEDNEKDETNKQNDIGVSVLGHKQLPTEKQLENTSFKNNDGAFHGTSTRSGDSQSNPENENGLKLIGKSNSQDNENHIYKENPIENSNNGSSQRQENSVAVVAPIDQTIERGIKDEHLLASNGHDDVKKRTSPEDSPHTTHEVSKLKGDSDDITNEDTNQKDDKTDQTKDPSYLKKGGYKGSNNEARVTTSTKRQNYSTIKKSKPRHSMATYKSVEDMNAMERLKHGPYAASLREANRKATSSRKATYKNATRSSTIKLKRGKTGENGKTDKNSGSKNVAKSVSKLNSDKQEQNQNNIGKGGLASRTNTTKSYAKPPKTVKDNEKNSAKNITIPIEPTVSILENTEEKLTEEDENYQEGSSAVEGTKNLDDTIDRVDSDNVLKEDENFSDNEGKIESEQVKENIDPPQDIKITETDDGQDVRNIALDSDDNVQDGMVSLDTQEIKMEDKENEDRNFTNENQQTYLNSSNNEESQPVKTQPTLGDWFQNKKKVINSSKDANSSSAKYTSETTVEPDPSVDSNAIVITTTPDTPDSKKSTDSKAPTTDLTQNGKLPRPLPASISIIDETSNYDGQPAAGRFILETIKRKLQEKHLSTSVNSSSLPVQNMSRSPSPEITHPRGAHKTNSMSSLKVPGSATSPLAWETPQEEEDNVSIYSRRDSSRLSIDSTARNSVDYRLRNTTTVIQPVTEEKPKVVLTKDETFIRNAIPYVPLSLAVVCFIMNTFIPGSGTALSGLAVLCCGQARVSEKGDQVFVTICANLMVGLAQLMTVTFLFVGWFWSIAWGILLIDLSVQHRHAMKEQRARELKALALSAFGSPKRGNNMFGM